MALEQLQTSGRGEDLDLSKPLFDIKVRLRPHGVY